MGMQLLVNSLYSFLMLALVAASFFLVFKPSKYFHISHAAVIVLSAYTFLFCRTAGLGPLFAGVAALAAATALGSLSELVLYRRLSVSRDAGIKVLVLSLGVYLVVQNILSIGFGDQIQLVDPCNGCLRRVLVGSSFVVSSAQLGNVVIAGTTLAGLLVVWYRTSFGRAARSVSENRELAGIIGVNTNRIILLSVALGSCVAGIAGLLIGFEVGITPTAGFSYLLFAIIAMVIGGNESLLGTIAGALLLGALQSGTAFFIDSKWASTISYVVLIAFLLIRPEGVKSLNLALERR
ncbi:MAG: branched-chain amino acid ABC transporter permease [Alphaproteobacteria bacterium]|nr:branched-chain amino acid ABC transporter permease [Alphaproteobacteria bacterium]